MACGRPVLVLDDRQYLSEMGDGIILPENIEEIMKNNCSGRRFKFTDTKKLLNDALEQYNPEYSKFYRDYALEYFDVKKNIDRYFKLVNYD